MKYALVNPPWTFDSSIYFGCREAHLPLEYGYSKRLLEQGGHEALIFDAQLDGFGLDELRAKLRHFDPDVTVVTTAPSYLFWRCAPPELRVPMQTVNRIRDVAGTLVVIGPHASTSPVATLRKLDAQVAILGECEEILPQLDGDWKFVTSIAYRAENQLKINGSPWASDMNLLPPLEWSAETISRHSHHHHRFDAPPAGSGAEMEASRGCPYHCTFCAKDNFRDRYRKRPLSAVFAELDRLISQGVEYIYFIDEIFLPNRDLLMGLADRKIKIGIQTRIDLWTPEMIEMLGQAGCVSIEAGVESITEGGRQALDKKCKLTTDELAERLIYAKSKVPFVQANLLAMQEDDANEVERWRAHLIERGVWTNKPVPLFSYPGSPEYTRRWGVPDDSAWERAHDTYLAEFDAFSDVQEERPARLVQLECR